MHVTSGKTYAIVFTTNDGTGYTIYGASAAYSRGEAYFLDPTTPGPWIPAGGDARFSTWVWEEVDVPRAGYCFNGRFLDLVAGQPDTDSAYAGAIPAIFVEGKGITCDPPPPGYAQHGYAGNDQHVPENLYPYYAPT